MTLKPRAAPRPSPRSLREACSTRSSRRRRTRSSATTRARRVIDLEPDRRAALRVHAPRRSSAATCVDAVRRPPPATTSRRVIEHRHGGRSGRPLRDGDPAQGRHAGADLVVALPRVRRRWRAGRRRCSSRRDITEQRLAQASLAEVEARVRESEALANVGQLAVGPANRSGAVERRVPSHPRRRSASTSTGRSTPISAGHPPRRPERGARRRWRRRSSQAARSSTSTAIVRPGRRRPYRPRAWLNRWSGRMGRVVGLRGIGQDITDRV